MKWALIITFTVLNLVHTTWGQNASGGAATPGGATPPSGGTIAPNPPRSPAAPGASGFPASPASPGLPATPVQPGLPASPTAPGLPGFTNASVSLNASNILGRLTPTNSFASTNGLAGIGITNQFGTNIFPFELQPLLANLQINIEQILPLLTAISSSP